MRKPQPLTGIDDAGKSHAFGSIAEAVQATKLSPPSIKKALATGTAAHGRRTGAVWKFTRGAASAPASSNGHAKPSDALAKASATSDLQDVNSIILAMLSRIAAGESGTVTIGNVSIRRPGLFLEVPALEVSRA